MSKYRKIVWNEGMLLTPHHFQQWDNYFEDLLNSRVQSAKQYDYGVLDIQVNNEAIANSNFQLTSCRAVLSDGLLVNVPDTEAVPDLRPVGDHFHPEQERLGVHLAIPAKKMGEANYQANGPNRCYFCKDELYGKLEALARLRGIDYIVDGSTTDDLSDYRPGRVAALEHLVRSPLIEVGMSKAEVRELSRRAGLPTWDKPASPCLSSRIAYGTPVTIERLSEVDRGEAILREMGFREFRVRHHDQLVRLEIAPTEMEHALDREVVQELARRFRELGFKYVTLELHGYRSGAMNEVLAT